MTRHLYVHIPYCNALCPYCDFLKGTPDKLPSYSVYTDALLRDLAAEPGQFETVFIGGGTPNEIPLAEMERLLTAIQARLTEDYEWTIEVNPQSFSPEQKDLLLRCGVNRLSIGIQSSSDGVLKRLGRTHRHTDSIRASALAREFRDVSGDIIFGLADDELEATVDFMAESGMTHVSAYELTIEGQSTWKRMKIDPSVGDDEKIEKLRTIETRLAAHGFGRYEVSNYSLPGHECRSHLNVWQSGEFAAIGAGGHGFENGTRYSNSSSVHEYVAARGQTFEPVENLAAETMLLAMRLKSGVRIDDLPEDRKFALAKKNDTLKKLAHEGFIVLDESTIRPTDKGLLFVNTIAEQMI